QIAGVTPKPPAAFSTLIINNSALLLSTRWCTCSRTILRPGLPKTSPINRICTRQDNRGKIRGSVRAIDTQDELIRQSLPHAGNRSSPPDLDLDSSLSQCARLHYPATTDLAKASRAILVVGFLRKFPCAFPD